MPKNKKPGGGRAAKNFDPRYNPKYRAASEGRDAQGGKRRPGESSAGKPGSRSTGHRGHRAEAPDAAAPKRRWSEQERAGRDEARAIRTHSRDDRGRPGRDRDDRRDSGRGEAPRRDAAPRRDNAPRREEGARRDAAPRRDEGARRDAAPRRDNAPRRAEPARRDVVHERLEAAAVAPDEVGGVTFADLGLGQNIVKTIAELGALHPFPIQAATIPAILAGRDVLARGRTGSGKTIAFGAPLVESVLRSQAREKRDFGRPPRALILAPTRELALQIDATVQPIARSVGLFTTQIYGGVPKARQLGALKRGIDIVIGTPGRIEDLVESRALDLSQVRIAVLDEADHMCDLGFLEPVQRIMRRTSRDAQRLLFSATLDGEVSSLVKEFLSEPAVYEVAGETQRTGTIDHRVLVVDHRDKRDILRTLVDRSGKTLVFTRTRAFAEMLADQLDDVGIRALALHGDLDQARRTRNLEKLTSGRIDVLVATDVAARGIHVDDIDLVVQADAPDEYKTYLHRSGRTGRAGRSGTVVTLVTRARRERLADLLERADIEAPFDEVRPGDDLLEELAGR
ncbi:DEAD/DEAH box helicase [Microbacterium trichothecenolyticum]|uniref:ATP-dependent RNA helicase RhlE n=1 Tax=Microbacterium trichothecenolyticum TaxID=69370 RepID=A0A0M2HEN6_MICTR|nr:DEAD/DEAH box helicase [Microbacterium trichothecenolyticum]KJL45100.1 ATP-dependent RNA helicase RhlE [Microbacterium trichothecenolyticum]